MRTGCDGIIGSKLQFDKCGICGGDSLGCVRVVGNFTKKRWVGANSALRVAPFQIRT